MNIILISTTDWKLGREDVRERMLHSIVDSERTCPGHRLTLALLIQNCTVDELDGLRAIMPKCVQLFAVDARVSLSHARNLILEGLAAASVFSVDSLVAFPDDDCWYPPGFLIEVVALFAHEPMLDFWFCRYSSTPAPLLSSLDRLSETNITSVVRNASSNTIFLRGTIVAKVGRFDETLGVGTPMGGAEDLDYALRAYRLCRKILYRDAALVGHRDKSSKLRARYYKSGLFVLAKNARHGAAIEFVRKIGVGIFLVLRGELTLFGFVKALRSALSAFRSPNHSC